MNPQRLLAAVLVLCLALVIVAFALGVEVGKVGALRLHPGYEAAAA